MRTTRLLLSDLMMYKNGFFIVSPTPFSEKDCGNETTIYMKLISELSESRWEAILQWTRSYCEYL